MLSRPFRLVKDKDFGQVMRKGRGYKMPEGQVKVLINGLSHNRFGLVVSNKISKKATERNLLKRRIREVLRAFDPKLKAGFDMVIVVYPPMRGKKFSEIKEILWRAFDRMYLIALKK